MPVPAAGAASGLAVLSLHSRAEPRPPTHWRRLCALIWSCCSPVSRSLTLAGGSSTCTLHEHAQMMLYRTQITSAIIRTCGSATGMVCLSCLCRTCSHLYATRAERAAEATSARVASTGTAECGSSCGSQLVSYHSCAVCVAAGVAGKVLQSHIIVRNQPGEQSERSCLAVGYT